MAGRIHLGRLALETEPFYCFPYLWRMIASESWLFGSLNPDVPLPPPGIPPALGPGVLALTAGCCQTHCKNMGWSHSSQTEMKARVWVSHLSWVLPLTMFTDLVAQCYVLRKCFHPLGFMYSQFSHCKYNYISTRVKTWKTNGVQVREGSHLSWLRSSEAVSITTVQVIFAVVTHPLWWHRVIFETCFKAIMCDVQC